MHLCPTCRTSFSGGEQYCPKDGTPLRASLPDDPLAGRVLSGRYRLLEVIGRGGMGAVYRAHHILLDKPVAVKVLRQELASDTEAVARFHREARSASRLDHEHIIRVSDFGQTDDGLLFLAMELLDGENLAQALRRGVLPWRRVLMIVRDIALGLAHAHEQGVIHRDLKPENIVLTRRGKSRSSVKVLDFGLAKLVSHRAGDATIAEPEPDLAVQSLTRTGVVFGTPEYMSPEQAEGRPLDSRTDLYALGVVTYQMLCGKLPFTAPTFLALIAKTVNEPPPSLHSQDPTLFCPQEAEDLVLGCLAKRPEDRPQTAEQIADRLDQILAAHPAETVPSGELSVPRSGEVGAVAGQSSERRPPSGPLVPPPGGVARTVQRLKPPADSSPREAPAEPVSPSGAAPVSSPGLASESKQAAKPAVPPSAKPDEGPGEGAGEGGDATFEPRMQRRPYWIVALALSGLLFGGIFAGRQRLFGSRGSAQSVVTPTPLGRASRLLRETTPPISPSTVAEAMQLLREAAPTQNTPELHRLLSLAYEAQGNRLRALGHQYTAQTLSDSPHEVSTSALALAQLLARLGQTEAACFSARRVLVGQSPPSPEHKRSAQALSDTLRCTTP